MAERGPQKAYRVEERWSMTSVSIVWAANAEEARRKVRSPHEDEEADIEVVDAITASQPIGITVRRAPEEDRRPPASEGKPQ